MSFRQLQYRRGWNQWRRWFSDRQYSGERGQFVSGDSHFQSVEDANSGSRQGNDTFSHRPTPLTGNSHFMSPPNLNQSSQFHQPRSVSGNGQLMGSPNSYYVLSSSKSGLGEAEFSKFHSNVKRGDIVGVTGFPGKTKRGEPSIFPRSFELLSHCLHMMPRKKAGSETVNSKKSVWEPGSARIPEAYILKDQIAKFCRESIGGSLPSTSVLNGKDDAIPPSNSLPKLHRPDYHDSIAQGSTMWNRRAHVLFSLSSRIKAPVAIINSNSLHSSTYSSKASSLSRRLDEEPLNVKIGVFWDLNTCELPTGVNLLELVPLLSSALQAKGIKGTLHIFGFGDMSSLSKTNIDQIQQTQIEFYNVPKGKKKLLADTIQPVLVDWVSKNPPPGQLFIISDYSHIVNLVCKFKEKYEILIASKGGTQSTISWKSMFAKVGNPPSSIVWWDFENCPVPHNVSVIDVKPTLEKLCKQYGIPKPLTIRGVGHFNHLKEEDREKMDQSGITFFEVKSLKKNAADRIIRREISDWMQLSSGRGPRNLTLISGDRGFRQVLIDARYRDIQTLLIYNEKAQEKLTREASISLMWETVLPPKKNCEEND